MPLSETPTIVALVQDGKLLYTGSCSLQIDIVKADGSTAPLATLAQNSFYSVPVSADYSLTVKGACCNAGDYEFFPDITTTPKHVDPEKIVYCNTDTNTQWVKTCVFTVDVDNVVTVEVMSDDDTGFACGAAIPQFDIEVLEYCNPATETKWIKHFRFTTSVVSGAVVTTEETISDVDTGFPCADPIIFEQEFCKS